jgi:hypothetical protein
MATRRLFDGAQIELDILPIVGSGSTSYNLSLSKGTYTLSGKDATLTFSAGAINYSISASKGTYALSGKDANFQVGKSIASEKGVYTLTGKNANLIYGGTGVNYSLVANKNTTNLIGSFVYLNINFTQAITYVSPSFVTGRIRVFNGTIWQDVITYQYKNSKFNEFTK